MKAYLFNGEGTEDHLFRTVENRITCERAGNAFHIQILNTREENCWEKQRKSLTIRGSVSCKGTAASRTLERWKATTLEPIQTSGRTRRICSSDESYLVGKERDRGDKPTSTVPHVVHPFRDRG